MDERAQGEGDGRRFEGVAVPDPGFAGDTGAQDPDVASALTAYAVGRGGSVAVLLALQGSRVLVPVVAVAGETEVVAGPDGRPLEREKSSDMAAVTLRGADGRAALLAFTGTAPLAAWDPAARPVPVTWADAARAAVAEGAEALVLDLGQPGQFVVEGETLAAVASGARLALVGDRAAWLAPGDSPAGE